MSNKFQFYNLVSLTLRATWDSSATTHSLQFYSFMYEDRAIKYFSCMSHTDERQSELQEPLIEERNHPGIDSKRQYQSI